tara:strand:+ start:679 stop:882 length:204 start_codon:yes stop_codon:yes gene_type:complete
MSDETPFQVKPIVDVKNTLHAMNRMLNEMKVDVICIKSDLKEIKEILDQKENDYKHKESIKSGWFLY